MKKSGEELIKLIDIIPDESAKEGEYGLIELASIADSREVRNDDIVFAGTGLPMLGMMTANMLHAPNATLIFEAGIVDGKSMHIPMSVSDQRACYMASSLGGLVDIFGTYLQSGFVTLGFLGGAAIDKYGGTNATCIGDYHNPQHRFPGSGGAGDIGSLSARIVYFIIQEKRRFVEKNEFTTTVGWWCNDWKTGKWRPKKEIYRDTIFADTGPSAVITNMAVFRFDDSGIMYLDTVHPGVTVEQVKENCGFELNVSMVSGETTSPTYKELFILREVVDPEGIFLPIAPEYPSDIKEIIEKA